MATSTTTKSTSKQEKSLAEIVAGASPVDVVVPICVAGELVNEHARLDRELSRMLDEEDEKPKSSNKLAGPTPNPEIDKRVKRLRQLEKQIEAETYDFVFHKMPGKNAWLDLVDEHPPRKGKERQERWNQETFPPAAVKACCVSPKGITDEETFANFWDDILNDGQRTDLLAGAARANEESLSVPFSVNVSAHLQTSEQNSTT